MEILTNEALREALETLSYRDRRVLELRYGLGGEHPRTLDEVGRTFNVTRERIRQIENQLVEEASEPRRGPEATRRRLDQACTPVATTKKGCASVTSDAVGLPESFAVSRPVETGPAAEHVAHAQPRVETVRSADSGRCVA